TELFQTAEELLAPVAISESETAFLVTDAGQDARATQHRSCAGHRLDLVPGARRLPRPRPRRNGLVTHSWVSLSNLTRRAGGVSPCSLPNRGLTPPARPKWGRLVVSRQPTGRREVRGRIVSAERGVSGPPVCTRNASCSSCTVRSTETRRTSGGTRSMTGAKFKRPRMPAAT